MSTAGRDRYNPWFDAAERYPWVHIEWRPIAPLHATWAPDSDVILVDESISRAERRCALAHEIAHMDTGDDPAAKCWFATRQESGADRLAARRLINPHDWASVLRYASDVREAAAELEVTVTLLRLRYQWMHPAERVPIQRVLQMREAVA